jgi:hypothetical protein
MYIYIIHIIINTIYSLNIFYFGDIADYLF